MIKSIIFDIGGSLIGFAARKKNSERGCIIQEEQGGEKLNKIDKNIKPW